MVSNLGRNSVDDLSMEEKMKAILIKDDMGIIQIQDYTGYDDFFMSSEDKIIDIDEDLLNEYMDIQRKYFNMQQLLRSEVE